MVNYAVEITGIRSKQPLYEYRIQFDYSSPAAKYQINEGCVNFNIIYEIATEFPYLIVQMN